MAEFDFPTLSQLPDVENFSEEAAVDPTYRSEFENGKMLTRARFTSVPDKRKVVYRDLPNADKEILKTFEHDTVHFGAALFNWTHPISGQVYEVRFLSPISYRLENTHQHQWYVTFEIAEK